MNKTINYTPSGVCSRNIEITTCAGTICSVTFSGGCHGNAQGIGALIKGMSLQEAIGRLSGIDCKGKGTSCPDQLARALQTLL